MGLTGWLGRRVLAALLFGPLLVFWYLVFSWVILDFLALACRDAPGGASSSCAPNVLPIAAMALVAAFLTDWLVIRAVKRSMKEGHRN